MTANQSSQQENQPQKTEFWEQAFNEKREMWGFDPALSAVIAKDFFVEQGIQNVLIPGFGYGRNAQVFREAGISVTGIEISASAIEMARKHYGHEMTIFHGSVTDMPFDDSTYDGIFCYALIHLLDLKERKQLINDCYQQLDNGGYMIFVAISKEAPTYGTGKQLSKDRYEIFEGVQMYFYDEDAIQSAFGDYGLLDTMKVQENFPFYLVKCQKAV